MDQDNDIGNDIEKLSSALTSAFSDLVGLERELEGACSAERAASSRRTNALNRLNVKQAEIDRYLAALKRASGGDWGTNA